MEIEPLKTSLAWVVYVDVFGFSSRVKQVQNDEVIELLKEAHQFLFNKILVSNDSVKIFILSDCLFLVFPTTHDRKYEVFQTVIEFTEDTLTYFLDCDLPLRGAAAFGEVITGDNLIIGTPVVRAAKLEGEFDYPLVVAPLSDFLESAKDISVLKSMGIKNLVEIEDKSGGIRLCCIMTPRPLASFFSTIERKINHHLIFGPPNVAAAWSKTAQLLDALVPLRKGGIHVNE